MEERYLHFHNMKFSAWMPGSCFVFAAKSFRCWKLMLYHEYIRLYWILMEVTKVNVMDFEQCRIYNSVKWNLFLTASIYFGRFLRHPGVGVHHVRGWSVGISEWPMDDTHGCLQHSHCGHCTWHCCLHSYGDNCRKILKDEVLVQYKVIR